MCKVCEFVFRIKIYFSARYLKMRKNIAPDFGLIIQRYDDVPPMARLDFYPFLSYRGRNHNRNCRMDVCQPLSNRLNDPLYRKIHSARRTSVAKQSAAERSVQCAMCNVHGRMGRGRPATVDQSFRIFKKQFCLSASFKRNVFI